jgi:hypothetical protein
MKFIKIVLPLLFASIFTNAQTTGLFKVQLVKEKPQVDSLIEKFKYRVESNKLKNDSCIVIFIYTKNGGSLFSVNFIDSLSNSNIYTGEPGIIKKKNLRYFKYLNNFVLIYGDADAYGLFVATQKFQKFNIHIVNDVLDKRKNDGFLYAYENGQFDLFPHWKK